MAQRNTLLIGSMPFENEEQAMAQALDKLSSSLFCLPDGEIGEKSAEYPKGKRSAWVMTAIDVCSKDTHNWEVVKQSVRDENGFPIDYASVQKLRPKHSPAIMDNYLKFGYDDFFKASYPVFKQLREERRLSNLKFQVGIPTGLGITLTMMQPLLALRYVDAFNRRIAFEVNEILKIAADDVIIQLEVPAEVAIAYALPSFLVGLALRSIYGLVKKITPNAEIGVHICLGDLNNAALTHAKTLDKMVTFANKLVTDWPTSHRLSYVHFPLAEAATPPPLEAAYYKPLQKITLPQGVRFVAGFVHEELSLVENQHILTTIEALQGTKVDIACSCGLGRRPQPVAEALIGMMQQLADF
jgi:hypothetical protein